MKATNTIKKKKKNQKYDPPRFVINVQKSDPKTSTTAAASAQGTTATTTETTTKSRNNDTVHVLVIAHPDDESMFFLPTISSLRDAGETIWIVCLTSGNYDGLGETRKAELSSVCELLNVDRLIQLDVESLQDHPTESWSLDNVTLEIERALSSAVRTWPSIINRLVLITFDADGVSGHINHRDTYLGVRNLIYKHQQQEQQQQEQQSGKDTDANKNNDNSRALVLPPLEAWKLDTVHLLPIKYLPVMEWFRLVLYHCWLWKPTYKPFPTITSTTTTSSSSSNKKRKDSSNSASAISSSSVIHVYRSADCLQSWKAMSTHQSQWVWYRRLFVIFSCYTFVNKLRPVQ